MDFSENVQLVTVGLLSELYMPPPRKANLLPSSVPVPPVMVKPSMTVSGPSFVSQVTTLPLPLASMVVTLGPSLLRSVTALPSRLAGPAVVAPVHQLRRLLHTCEGPDCKSLDCILGICADAMAMMPKIQSRLLQSGPSFVSQVTTLPLPLASMVVTLGPSLLRSVTALPSRLAGPAVVAPVHQLRRLLHTCEGPDCKSLDCILGICADAMAMMFNNELRYSRHQHGGIGKETIRWMALHGC